MIVSVLSSPLAQGARVFSQPQPMGRNDLPLLVRLAPPVEPRVSPRTNILLGRPMFWRTGETLAIAMIVCMIVGLAIHRLSALPGRTSLFSETPELRNVSQSARSTARVLASSQQPVMTRNSRQSSVGGEGDSVAEKNTTPRSGVRVTFSRGAGMFAADTVVQYGADVTMWSGNIKRAELDRLGR